MAEDRIVGVDCGTMFYQTAEYAEKKDIKYKNIRNAFVEMFPIDDIEEILKRNSWQYVRDGNNYYVIGEDSLQVAKMFPGKIEVRRPMQEGVLNKNEEKKTIIMSQMIESSIGNAPTENSWVCTCISSESIDGSSDSSFHKARLEAMFKRLGWKVKVIEEAQAVVLSERPTAVQADGTEVPYTGIACSFGSGRSNCVLAYKGIPVVGMSCSVGGDFIDKQVSEQTGCPISQVIDAKEKRLNFNNIDMEDDIIFALDTYYEKMMTFVFKNFSKKFMEVKSNYEYPLEIVVAGGTSMPEGFCKKLESVIKKMQLPFKIKNVRHAKSPRNAVVEGLLIAASVAHKKSQEESLSDIM